MLSMDDITIIKCLVLKRLIRSNMWGGKHTPLDFIMKGLPENFRMRPEGKRAIDKALKEMTNDEWLNIEKKRTGKGYDDHISLNQERAAEIQQFLSDK